MGWADTYIDRLLKKQEFVEFRPQGNSMEPLIKSGQLVRLSPIYHDQMPIFIDDIVLCKVKGKQYLHIVKDIKGDRFLIGNNKGHINGWINRNSIYGVVFKIGT